MADLDKRVMIVLDAMGSDKVLKDIKKVEGGLKEVTKVTTNLHKATTDPQLGVANQNRLKKLKAEATAQKIGAVHAKSNLKRRKQEQQQLIKEFKAIDKRDEKQRANIKKTAELKKKASLGNRRFAMEYLGIMFAGMAMQKVFGGMFKSLINNYKELGNKSNPLNVALTRLEANFTFLKYSIMEAASGPFTLLINGLASFANWLALIDPRILMTIAMGIAFLASVGTAMYITGQFMIGMQAFLKVMQDLQKGGFASMLGRLASGLAGLVSIGVGIYIAWDLMDGIDDARSRLFSQLGISSAFMIGGALLGLAIGGPIGAAIGAGTGLIVGVSLALGVSILDTVWEDGATWEDFKKALQKNMSWFTWKAGAASLAMGPGGLIIAMTYGLFKTVFDVGVELDARQKGIIGENADKLAGIYDEIQKEALRRRDESVADDNKPFLSLDNAFKQVWDERKGEDMGEGQNLGNLFGMNLESFKTEMAEMTAEMDTARANNAAKFAADKTAETLANKGVTDSYAAGYTGAMATAGIETLAWLKDQKDGGAAILELAATANADFDNAFRNRSMTVTIKYKEEGRPSSLDDSDSISSSVNTGA